jgi:hypothetical protein
VNTISEKLKYPLVIIEWSDAMTIKDNWHTPEKDIDEPAICISVGFLIGDKPNVKILYASIALEDQWTQECGKGNIIIPTNTIISMKKLQEID